MQSLVDVADDEHNTNTTTPVLVATTLFTVVLGAVIWRSSVHHNLSFSLKSRCAPVVDTAETQLEADEKAKTAARSKERRKRGKDPLKDVLKGNKRTKATLSKLAKALDTHASTTTTPSDYVRAGTSCRSISTASSSRTSDDREDPFLPTSLGRIGSSVSSASRSVSTASSSHDGDNDDDDDAETPHGRSDDISEFPPPASPTTSHSTSTSRSSIPSLVDSVSTSSADTIQTDIMDAEPFEGQEGLGHPKDECLGGSPPKPRNKKSQPAAAGPSKRRAPPSGSRPGTPPPQTQLASLRGALEAARLREENARRDLERFGKELEMLRWEREAGRQREAELRAQMQQMQAYMAALFHAPSPVSPMFAYPSPGFYPAPNMHPAFSTSSSPGGSPSSRGRRRTRTEEEDIGVSEMLADAILKRPGAMNLGKREEEEPSSPSPQPKNAPIEELTFPSLYPPQ